MGSDDVVTLVGDVSDEDAAKRLVELALGRFGRLAILVNNAGRTLNKPLTEVTVEDYDRILRINARGSFVTARAGVEPMARGGGGAIVNVASISAVAAFETQIAYASKAAVAQLTRVIAIEYGKRGIRADAVLPGVIDTDIMEGVVEGDGRAMLRGIGDQHPIGRIGQPEEIAETIAFLASPAASFITGALLLADGGGTAR